MLSILKLILWIFPGFFGLLWDPFRKSNKYLVERFTASRIYLEPRYNNDESLSRVKEIKKVYKILKRNSIDPKKLPSKVTIEFPVIKIKDLLKTYSDKRIKNYGVDLGVFFYLDKESISCINSQLRIYDLQDFEMYEPQKICEILLRHDLEAQKEMEEISDTRCGNHICSWDGEDEECPSKLIDYSGGRCVLGKCSDLEEGKEVDKKSLKKIRSIYLKSFDKMRKAG